MEMYALSHYSLNGIKKQAVIEGKMDWHNICSIFEM